MPPTATTSKQSPSLDLSKTRSNSKDSQASADPWPKPAAKPPSTPRTSKDKPTTRGPPSRTSSAASPISKSSKNLNEKEMEDLIPTGLPTQILHATGEGKDEASALDQTTKGIEKPVVLRGNTANFKVSRTAPLAVFLCL